MTSVKWLARIEAATEPFRGYQQAVAYRFQRDEDDPGEPVTRMRPRALVIPPGFPEFLTRRRVVERGHLALRGRAWSGGGDVVRVEVGVDGRLADAALDPPVGAHAWRGWRFEWDAEPGEHEISCRATDASGAVQPADQPWNVQGMGNNFVHRVPVTVR